MLTVKHVSAEELIRTHHLTAHPEGGYFRETYRSPELIPSCSLPARYRGDRCYSTAIYYLLPKGVKSHLHRVGSDEIWHFYLGGPLRLVLIHADTTVEEVVLGPDVIQGQRLQYVVKAGTWFGAYPEPASDFSFVGCTVAPGFDFSDFELGSRKQLLNQYPQAKDVIERLTRECATTT